MDEIDLNKDGKIDFDEFIMHINKAVDKVKSKLDASNSSSKNNSKKKPKKE